LLRRHGSPRLGGLVAVEGARNRLLRRNALLLGDEKPVEDFVVR
jgi:hypothetical protein